MDDTLEPSGGATADAQDPKPPRRREIVRKRPELEAIAAVLELDPAGQPALDSAAVQSPSTRRRHRPSAEERLAPFRDRMGNVPDDEIAHDAGVSRGVVGAYRRKHGIPAYEGYLFQRGHAPLRPRTQVRPAVLAGTSRIEPFADLVGVEPDATVAEKAGVSRSAVTAWRKRHGIAASQPRAASGRELAKTLQRHVDEARAASTVTVRTARAFAVVASTGGAQREFVAMGLDIVDACRRAEAGLAARDDGPWTVDRIQLLGEAFA